MKLATRCAGALALVAATLCPGILGWPAAHAQDAAKAPAILRVVHGIPGRDVAPDLDPQLPVDVLVDGKVCLLKGFTFGAISNPFSIPPGRYDIKVSLANTLAPCSNAAVIDAPVSLRAGEEAAVVAALSPAGAPTAYAFALDFTAVRAGDGRIMVAHAADAPAVDVAVNGTRAIVGLPPGQEKSAQLPAGKYTVAVYPTGGSTPVVGPLTLALAKRAVTLVFAVGSAASGSITVLTRQIDNVF